jgi:hypothetical protein
MLKTTAALILTAGLATACMSEPAPYSGAQTATGVPTSATVPPFDPNRNVTPFPSATLPPAPPEIVGPSAP